tara:strand:+ start:818 stop:931 length:114 start_codon:yes stop_codon:yes gene_type:complete
MTKSNKKIKTQSEILKEFLNKSTEIIRKARSKVKNKN